MGLAVIMVASVTLTGSSLYPGALVAIPTLGAGLVVAGGRGGAHVGSRATAPAQDLPVPRCHLLPALPVALADPRDRRAEPRGDEPAGVGQRLAVARGGRAGDADLLLLREPDTPLPIPGAAAMGQPRHGPVSHRRHARSDDLRATPAHGQSGNPRDGHVRLHLSLTIAERGVALAIDLYVGQLQGTEQSETQDQTVVVVGDSTACTLLPGLQAVGPSYGLRFENGAVIGCGIVSGVIAPVYVGGVNSTAYTDKCQGEANLAETQAIERYRPSLIVWGSTDETASIVADTPTGSKVLDAGSAEWRSVMLQRMNDRVEGFVATGARVILLLEPPPVHGKTRAISADRRL